MRTQRQGRRRHHRPHGVVAAERNIAVVLAAHRQRELTIRKGADALHAHQPRAQHRVGVFRRQQRADVLALGHQRELAPCSLAVIGQPLATGQRQA